MISISLVVSWVILGSVWVLAGAHPRPTTRSIYTKCRPSSTFLHISAHNIKLFPLVEQTHATRYNLGRGGYAWIQCTERRGAHRGAACPRGRATRSEGRRAR